MKQHHLAQVILWTTLISPLILLGQTYPTPANFCENNLEEFCPPISMLAANAAKTALETRYADDVGQDLPTNGGWPTTEGATACAEPFDIEVKLALLNFESTINSERSVWNHNSEIAFFRDLDEVSLVFFDDEGDQIGSHSFVWQDFYQSLPPPLTNWEWNRKLTTIRWVPRENAIFYPREHELIKRSVQLSPSFQLGPPQAVVRFPGYTIGGSNIGYDVKIAGGDGNDVEAGRFLISMAQNGTQDVYYLVYDFGLNKIIEQVVDFTASIPFVEYPRDPVNFASYLTSLGEIDFAQVSASGLYLVVTTMSDIRLFDFTGRRYDIDIQAQSSSDPKEYLIRGSHPEVGFILVDDPSNPNKDMVRECIIVKAGNAATSSTISIDPIGDDNGDMVAVYWKFDVSDAQIKWGWEKLISWAGASTGATGGGQYSSITGISSPPVRSITDEIPFLTNYSYRALISMNTVAANPGWPAYYGEIVEMSLNHHDLQPRRLIHHRITSQSSAIEQPEAWFSPDGQKVFFKSPEGAPNNREYLYFIDLPDRTCKSTRTSLGSIYREYGPLLSPESIRIYPNPVSHGRSMWIEGITEEAAFDAELHLIGLDGRSHAIWQGELQAGQAEKIPLTDFASGMYIAEVRDASNGAIRFRQKVVIR